MIIKTFPPILLALSTFPPIRDIWSRACMSSDLSAIEKSVKEILIDLMAKKVISRGAQASSMRGLQASPSTVHWSGPSQTTIKKWSKHHDDLANMKLIPSVLPNYIPHLAGAVSHDNVWRDFDYTLIVAYLLKGNCAIGMKLGHIMMLKINDFNLGDRKNYGMLAPHKNLKKKTGKKSKIIP